MKKFIFVFMFCILIFSGCSINETQNSHLYVTAIGVDKDEITFVCVVPEAKSKESNFKITVNHIKSDNIFTASDFNSVISIGKTDFSHCRLILFSQDVAKQGLEKYNSTLLNERSMRPDTYIAVSENTAYECLNEHTKNISGNISDYFRRIFNSPYSATCTVKEFCGGRKIVLPLLDNHKAYGSVIYSSENELIPLNEKQTVFYKILSSEKTSFYTQTPNKEEILWVNCEKSPDISVKTNNGMHIFVTLYINAELISNKTDTNTDISKYLENYCLEFLNFVSENTDADILSVKQKARKNFLTNAQMNRYNIEENFKNAKYYVKVIYTQLKTGERNLDL